MKLRTRFSLFLALLILLLTASSAHAQTSVYGTVALTDFGISNSENEEIGFSNDSAGITGGSFYNFPTQSRLVAGLDARASYSPGSHGGESVLGALRISFVPHKNPLRPYLQIGGGVITEPYTSRYYTEQGVISQSVRFTGGAAEFLVGLDIRLNSAVDVRAIEYGAAAGPKVGFGFIGAGVVYHFPAHTKPHP